MLANYRLFFADRELRRIVATSLLARLPIGMNSLAITLTLQASTGSFAQAGVVASAYLLGVAVQAPIIGRMIDQRGPASLIWPLTLAHALALLAIVFAAQLALPLAFLFTASALAGLFFPPVSMTIRAMYRKAELPDSIKQTAFALESIIMELCFITGPLLVTLAASVGEPQLAVIAAAGLATLGVWQFARSGALQRWGQVEQEIDRHWAGPLAYPAVRRALLLSLSFGLAIGLIEIACAGYSQAKSWPGLVGILFAAMSVSSALSGLAYGARTWPLALARQCLLSVLWLALGALLMSQLDGVAAMILVSFLIGAGFGPGLAAMNLQLGKLTPSAYSTEAFTWSMTLFMGGLGVGFLLGGLLIERHGWSASMLASGLAFLLAAVVCLSLPRLHLQGTEDVV